MGLTTYIDHSIFVAVVVAVTLVDDSLDDW